MAIEISPFLDELHTVEENCLYTAQAHFIIASRKGVLVKTLQVSAALISAVGGCLVAIDCPKWFGLFPAVGGIVGTIVAAVGLDRNVHTHLVAANALTKLRHEARAMRTAFSTTMPPEELVQATRRITEAYNNMIQGLPPTDGSAMEKARKSIQSGKFEPDFRSGTNASAALPGRTNQEK